MRTAFLITATIGGTINIECKISTTIKTETAKICYSAGFLVYAFTF